MPENQSFNDVTKDVTSDDRDSSGGNLSPGTAHAQPEVRRLSRDRAPSFILNTMDATILTDEEKMSENATLEEQDKIAETSNQSEEEIPPASPGVLRPTSSRPRSAGSVRSQTGRDAAFPTPTSLRRKQEEYRQEARSARRGSGEPTPAPPTFGRSDLVAGRDFTKLDLHVQKLPAKLNEGPLSSLVDELVSPAQDDTEKVRAIFRWIASQHITTIETPSTAADHQVETVTDKLLKVKTEEIQYSGLFYDMCSLADVTCRELQGYVKGAKYVLGEDVPEASLGSWNAVLLGDTWWLVDAHWGSRHVITMDEGPADWVQIDDAGNRIRSSTQGGSTSSEVLEYRCNEFYFLSAPEEFIFTHFPLDGEEWQLLTDPVTLEQFHQMVYVKPEFFTLSLDVITHRKCVIVTSDPGLELKFGVPPAAAKSHFKYKLYREKTSDNREAGRFLFMELQGENLNCEFRLPQTGKYKFELYAKGAGEKSFALATAYIIDFSGSADADPLPGLNEEPWGPGLDVERLGLVPVSHPGGLVTTETSHAQIEFNMEGDNTEHLELATELLSNDISPEVLSRCVVHRQEGGKVTFNLNLPGSGEYALQIFGARRQEEDTEDLPMVCNYLVRNTDQASTKPVLYPALLNGKLGLVPASGDLAVTSDPEVTYLQRYTNEEMIVKLQANRNMHYLCELHLLTPEDAKDVSEYVMFNNNKGQAEVKIRFPAEGTYHLSVYGRDATAQNKKNNSFANIYNYIIIIHEASILHEPFPRPFDLWSAGCVLIEPERGQLPGKTKIRFAAKIPGARKVAVVGKEWSQLALCGEVWEADVDTGNNDKLTLTASYTVKTGKGPRQYTSLLVFKVNQPDEETNTENVPTENPEEEKTEEEPPATTDGDDTEDKVSDTETEGDGTDTNTEENSGDEEDRRNESSEHKDTEVENSSEDDDAERDESSGGEEDDATEEDSASPTQADENTTSEREDKTDGNANTNSATVRKSKNKKSKKKKKTVDEKTDDIKNNNTDDEEIAVSENTTDLLDTTGTEKAWSGEEGGDADVDPEGSDKDNNTDTEDHGSETGSNEYSSDEASHASDGTQSESRTSEDESTDENADKVKEKVKDTDKEKVKVPDKVAVKVTKTKSAVGKRPHKRVPKQEKTTEVHEQEKEQKSERPKRLRRPRRKYVIPADDVSKDKLTRMQEARKAYSKPPPSLSRAEREQQQRAEREARERDIRARLRAGIEAEDRMILETAVRDFTNAKLKDTDGDFKTGSQMLSFLRARDSLMESMESQNLDRLRLAIRTVERGGHEPRLREEMARARKLLESLERIEALRRDVLNMDASTWSEVRRYSSPHPLVHKVIIGALLILGDHEGRTKHWINCQMYLNTIGSDGLNRRVGKFNVDDLHPEVAARAKVILRDLDLEEVREVSAGVGTFYTWAIGMIAEFESRNRAIMEDIHPASLERQKEILRGQRPPTPRARDVSQPVAFMDPPASPYTLGRAHTSLHPSSHHPRGEKRRVRDAGRKVTFGLRAGKTPNSPRGNKSDSPILNKSKTTMF